MNDIKQPTLEQVNRALIELDILMSLTKDPALLDNLCALYAQTYSLKLRLTKEASC
jgi:hypothetical protein